MNDDLAEEIATLGAIYSEDNFVAEQSSKDEVVITMKYPFAEDGNESRKVAASFVCSPSYPISSSPLVELEGLPRGLREPLMARIAELAAENAGSPMLFTLIEAIREKLLELADESARAVDEERRAREAALTSSAAARASSLAVHNPAAARGITIVHSEPTVIMKSTFVAHVARVRCREDCEAVIAELYQDSKIARATHNMRAYRFHDAASGALVCDNDDDGEDAAGGRMAMLLEAMKADNLIVIVTRWYGGVLMGPLRFKVINDVARQLIESQEWYEGRHGVEKSRNK